MSWKIVIERIPSRRRTKSVSCRFFPHRDPPSDPSSLKVGVMMYLKGCQVLILLTVLSARAFFCVYSSVCVHFLCFFFRRKRKRFLAVTRHLASYQTIKETVVQSRRCIQLRKFFSRRLIPGWNPIYFLYWREVTYPKPTKPLSFRLHGHSLGRNESIHASIDCDIYLAYVVVFVPVFTVDLVGISDSL